MEAGLRARLKALPPAARAELLHVLRLPDLDRAEAIDTFWGHPETRTFGELLIDLEKDKAARAVVLGLLRDGAQVPDAGRWRRFEPRLGSVRGHGVAEGVRREKPWR